MGEEIVINAAKRQFSCGPLAMVCRIGKDGSTPMAHGREGDGKTPLGEYKLRFGLYRADRLPAPPPSRLTFRPLRQDDGWCDAPGDAAYNRFVRLPYPGPNHQVSHERLWRDDGAYDIILVMSHNDSPPIPGHGSAVFIHVAQPDDRDTLGCIALAPEAMVKLLPRLKTGMNLSII